MTNIKELGEDIKRYYKISLFINKYITLITTFILSLLIIIFSNVQSTSILAYSSSDINKNAIKYSDTILSNIGVDTDWFNNKSKYIKSSIIFTKTDIDNGILNLGYGVFKDSKGLYFPSNISIDESKYEKFILNAKNLGFSYVSLIKNSKQNITELKIPKLKKETNKKIIDEYNLGCMDTIMSETSFCNYNKYKLISDLLKNNKLEISKGLYDDVIESLDIDTESKCKISSSIFFKKYNYDSISDIIENNCDDITISRIKIADELVKLITDDKLFSIKSEYQSSVAYLTQLINQTSYIIKKDKLPSEVIVSYITLIEKGIKKNYINSNIAEVLVYTLRNYVINRVDVNNKAVINNINTLLNGDEALGTRGLISFVSNKNIIKDDVIITDNNNVVRSKREVLKNIIAYNFKNEIVLTDKVVLTNKNKVLNIKANILLIYKDKRKFITKKVPVEFFITELKDSTFNIKNLKILSKEINNYLGQFPRDFESFEEMYSLLKERLYAPLIKNDWSKTSSNKLTLCERMKNREKNITCKDGIIIVDSKDLGYKGNIKISLKLNENLRISKIQINSGKYYVELDNILKERIYINNTLLGKFFNLGFSKLDNKKYETVLYMLKRMFTIYVNKSISKKVGLKGEELDKLESKFKTFLGAEVSLVRKNNDGSYNVYFEIGKTMFLGKYNYKKNLIESLSLLNPRRVTSKYNCSGLTLKLSNTNTELLNGFKSDPIGFMKGKCPTVISKYLNDTKQE